MSKIWKKPIAIPAWVEVSVDNNLVKVKWPKWELSQKILDCVSVKVEDGQVVTSITNDENKPFRGLSRSLINNMIEWVTKGFEKKLMIIWVWYGAQVQWSKIILSLWYSHKVEYTVPQGVSVSAEQDAKWNTILNLTSIDKQLIWEVAAKIKTYRKTEPYKGKWIRYIDEYIKLKPGKSAK